MFDPTHFTEKKHEIPPTFTYWETLTLIYLVKGNMFPTMITTHVTGDNPQVSWRWMSWEKFWNKFVKVVKGQCPDAEVFTCPSIYLYQKSVPNFDSQHSFCLSLLLVKTVRVIMHFIKSRWKWMLTCWQNYRAVINLLRKSTVW